MSRQSRQERREERDRVYEEQQAAARARVNAERLQQSTKQEEEAQALLNLGPDELALRAAKAYVASREAVTVDQQIASFTRSAALSNLAIISMLGEMFPVEQ